MLQYNKKYIITGAPGSGKTTLINALAEQFICMPEVSRKVIVQEQLRGTKGTPWEDLERFATLVYEAFVQLLNSSPQACFTDRSILDLLSYLRVAGKAIPRNIEAFPYREKFHEHVFFAPTWREIYHEDEQRLQSFDFCVELEKALLRDYRQKGFKLLMLSKVSVSKRLNFVTKNINGFA